VKILVLGASGMLGHKVWSILGNRFETLGTVRQPIAHPAFASGDRIVAGVQVDDLPSVQRVISEVRPEVVVNCIGIVKQVSAARAHIPSITVNALFPHQLAELTASIGARMIQISTDCVFSGRQGGYSEDDEPDPIDLYGRTKLLGETPYDHTLTIRTSIIGRELVGAHGLLEWFLSQTGPIRGYTRAAFSGVTTRVLAETLGRVIADQPQLAGTWHVAGEKITKYDLLRRLADVYEHDVVIEPDERVVIDRSLDDTRFRTVTELPRPNWADMLEELRRDPTPYGEVRAAAC
jgi:dTDP-4-dehydrorhamnose reductase